MGEVDPARVTALLEVFRHECLKEAEVDSTKRYNFLHRAEFSSDALEVSEGGSLGFDQQLQVVLQFVDCVEGRPHLAGGEVPVDPQVHETLCRYEL